MIIVFLGMLFNLWNVIWCTDIVICKNQISNKYFHKKWHSPDQSFPAALLRSQRSEAASFLGNILQCSALNIRPDVTMILTNLLDHNPWIPWQMDCWQFSTGLSEKWDSDVVFTLKTDKEESAKFPTPLERTVENTFLFWVLILFSLSRLRDRS